MVPLPLQLTKLADTVCSGRFGASTSQHSTLLHDDTQFLLALAIADHAIWGVNTLDDLWQLQIPDGDNELPLRWNDSVMHLPILRKATMRDGVTNEPLLKGSFERIVKSVLNLSGFFEDATVHAIRRFVGKKINGTFLPEGFLTPLLLTEVYSQVYRSRKVSTCPSRRSTRLGSKLCSKHLWGLRKVSCPR